MNLAANNNQFMGSLRGADLVFCDGYGVATAARLMNVALLERLTPMDWMEDLLATSNSIGLSVFLLGDETQVVEACKQSMVTSHHRLNIVGTHHGFFRDADEGSQVIALVNEARPDLLLVGMGMPAQEFWIDENIAGLDIGVALPVGALFRWYSGAEKRAPRILSDHGLEWLWRLAHHPVRLFRRYVVGNIGFIARVTRARLTGGA
ncbi:MAG: WecB/TagA/CpsF family glycosyltransferase [Acidimicrobiia bacterium]